MALYKLHKSEDGTTSIVFKQISGLKISIPFNEENRDYQEYLEWVAIDGNEPEEAD
tara:strand:- start:289 stop:456 length:168 start_codon:yes stop_codon:yes gene_type:complete